MQCLDFLCSKETGKSIRTFLAEKINLEPFELIKAVFGINRQSFLIQLNATRPITVAKKFRANGARVAKGTV